MEPSDNETRVEHAFLRDAHALYVVSDLPADSNLRRIKPGNVIPVPECLGHTPPWIDRAVQEPDPQQTPLIVGWDYYWDLPLVFMWMVLDGEAQWIVQSELLMEGLRLGARRHAFRSWQPIVPPRKG